MSGTKNNNFKVINNKRSFEGICIHSRLFLKRNKIFFETVAALLLSVMAIIVSILQFNTTSKQTTLIEKQTDIANLQTNLAKEQVEQQRQQTSLTKKQTDIANLQTSLTKDQIKLQHKEAAITKAKDWAELRILLQPIVDKYPMLGSDDENPSTKNLSRENKRKWLSEMEPLVYRLGTNPVLIYSQHNYERYLSMIMAIYAAKLALGKKDESADEALFYQCTVEIGKHARRMWWDFRMMGNAMSSENNYKVYEPTALDENYILKGFPWDEELRGKNKIPPDKK